MISDADVEAEIAKARERYAGDTKTLRYFESERGRNYIRSTLRRSRVVEQLVDDWLAAHPEHPAIPHVEDGPADSVDEDQARVGRQRRRDRSGLDPRVGRSDADASAPPTTTWTPRRPRPSSRQRPRPTSRRPPADQSSSPSADEPQPGRPRCSFRWSSSPAAVASAPTTSTRGCSGSGSSSSATRSRTTSRT